MAWVAKSRFRAKELTEQSHGLGFRAWTAESRFRVRSWPCTTRVKGLGLGGGARSEGEGVD